MTAEQTSHKVADSIENGPSKARNQGIAPAGKEATDNEKAAQSAIMSFGMPKFDDLHKKRQYMKEHMAGAFRYLGAEGTSD